MALALVAMSCCLVAPLLLAAGLGLALLAIVGASALAALTAAIVFAVAFVERRRSRTRSTANEGRPLVEILSFDGCPNHDAAITLVERLGEELGIEPQIHLVNVPDPAAAQRLRFLGSPTIRVGGRDIDPHAGERGDYALACRVFRTDSGIAPQPDERWVREALLRETAIAL